MRGGIDARTGKALVGWPHCEQSIRRCLRTRFRSIEMRHHIGSDVMELQDANGDPATIFRVIAAIASALADDDGGEPGFRLEQVEVISAARKGRFLFMMTGLFYPLGHLGDYSIFERQSVTWGEAA